MADLYTDRLGPAAGTSEPLARQSRHDPGAGLRRRPAKPAAPDNAGAEDKRNEDKRNENSRNEEARNEDAETPPHQIDRLA